ncbi:MAG: NrfD/PsrC family molybdoenzyme membrane anchor subunit [Trueperaceae bacterium]
MRNFDLEQGADPAVSLRQAAVRPMQRSGLGYWALFVALTFVVLAGAAAWVYQLVQGLGVTGLNQNVTWGIYTADLVTFIGFSYGGALVSAILRLTHATWRASITRIAEACALVTLLIGATFPLIHLGRPERTWRLFVDPNGTSPIVWDTVAILSYLIATVIFFYLPLIPDLGILLNSASIKVGAAKRRWWKKLAANWRGLPEQRRSLERALAVMAIIIVPIAVAVHSVLAWAFSVTTRPGWHSTIFAPYFVVAALYSGVALVIVAVSAYRRAYRLQAYIVEKQFRYLGYILIALGLTYLYFTFAEFLTEGYASTGEGIAVASMLLTGRYSLVFWPWVVGGLLVPILLVALPWTRTIAGITTASVLVMVGMWVKRFLIVIPPMELSLVGHEIVPYNGSLVEVTLTLAAGAAIPWLLMIVFRFVPVLPIYEIEEVAHEEAMQRAQDNADRVPAQPAAQGASAVLGPTTRLGGP